MYLVDGNNVIGQRPGWHRDRVGARHRLLQEMAALARRRKIKLSVVFDGAPEPHFPDGSNYCGVKIFYARPGADADARIVEIVEDEPHRQHLVVITSDRALAERVRVCGVKVIRSGEFRRLLDETVAAPVVSPRVDSDETDQWLRYFGVDDDDEDVDFPPAQKGGAGGRPKGHLKR
jgi:predicted RNA-binding protein with PIN domain